MTPKNGLIITNGWYRGAKQAHQVARLIQEAAVRGIRLTEKVNNVPCVIGDVFCTDFIVFLDKDLALLENLEKGGLAVFNGLDGVRAADDKAITAMMLQSAGIKTPRTVVAPKCYNLPEDGVYLKKVFTLFEEKPLIVKERESSLGMGVYRAECYEDLVEIVKKIGLKPHLFQEEVTKSHGVSRRIYVAGGKIIGAMTLKNAHDFKSNAECGGIAEKYLPTGAEIETALRVAAVLNLTFCGVDLFVGEEPNVIEVNSNAYFEVFEKVTESNAAGAVIDAILTKLL